MYEAPRSSTIPEPVYSPGGFLTVSAGFTRPADTTAYTIGDLVANSTSAAVPLQISGASRFVGEAIRLERCRMKVSNTTLTNASFRVYVFRGDPTLTVQDNAQFNNSSVLACAIARLVGHFDVTLDTTGSDGAKGIGVPATGSGVTLAPDDGSTLFILVEARAAYTPTSAETFTITFEGVRS